MHKGARKAKPVKAAIENLENQPRDEGPEDGTLEDQVSVAIEKISSMAFTIEDQQNKINGLQHNLQIALIQNLAAIDILGIVLGIPYQAFDAGYNNVLAFNQKINPDATTHILSRQAALKRKLIKEGLIVDG